MGGLSPAPTDKAREKIRKLLRLAESANVHEAANAAARARTLMDRHRIEAASIEASAQTDEVCDHPDTPLWSFARPPRWRVGLAAAVAETGGCKIYLRHHLRSVDAILVGRRCDVDDVRFLEGVLATQIERLTRAHARGRGRRWGHAFRLGAVATVAERLERAHEAASAPTAPGAQSGNDAVALARLAAVDSQLQTWMAEHLDLRPARRRTIHADPGGYASGRAAAESIALASQPKLSARDAAARS